MANLRRKRGCLLFLVLLAAKDYDASALLTTKLPRRLDDAIERGLLIEPIPNVFVLGTVHIGNESAEEVSLLIDSVKPSTVVVEMAPSRAHNFLLQAQDSNSKNRSSKRAKATKGTKAKTNSKRPSAVLFETIPALASLGWEIAGASGVLFAAGMIGGSLLKQSLSINAEDATSLPPREDEFEAAVRASDNANARVIFADYELDELISEVANVMTLLSWLRVGTCSVLEDIGCIPRDPLLRTSGESVVKWIERRRHVMTARSSRINGEKTCFELSQILVDARDERFATSCFKAMQEGSDGEDALTVICVVGLVHLDGIASRLEQK